MEQMISNIWNINALLGGIILLIFLILVCVGIVGFIFAILLHPFVKKYEE